MGHFEHEWEEYNPATDRNSYGPVKYVLDEKDKEKEQKEWAEGRESENINYLIDEIKATNDYDKIQKVHEAIEKAQNLSFESKNFYTSNLRNHIKTLQIKEENERQDRAVKYQKQEQERKEKRAAFDKAKKRYQSVGTFWKITHFNKIPGRIDYQSMSVEQINKLYGGKKR